MKKQKSGLVARAENDQQVITVSLTEADKASLFLFYFILFLFYSYFFSPTRSVKCRAVEGKKGKRKKKKVITCLRMVASKSTL